MSSKSQSANSNFLINEMSEITKISEKNEMYFSTFNVTKVYKNKSTLIVIRDYGSCCEEIIWDRLVKLTRVMK